MIQSIIAGIAIKLITGLIENLTALLLKMIETWQRNNKLDGQAQNDFDDLAAKKKAKDEAKALGGEAYEKAKADLLAAASKFGRIRV